jgi:Transcriptional Coactivator p15 (PC4)
MTRPSPTLSAPLTVGEWWKNRGGESIRVTLSTYAGRNLIDLRTWYMTDGKLQPGKGFAADVKHLPRLAAALTKAQAKATELGLLPANATMTTGAAQ